MVIVTMRIRLMGLSLVGLAIHCPVVAWQPETVGVGLAYTSDARESVALEAAWQTPQPDWRIRGKLEHGLYKRNQHLGWVAFEESFERNSIGIFIDRQLPAGLYISGGLLHFDQASQWTASPKADAVYSLNGRYYAGIQLGKPEATISYQPLIPYLGMGWSTPLSYKDWSVQFEAGALVGLDPKLTMRSNNPANLPFLNADLQYEADRYVDRLKTDKQFLDSTAPHASITAIYHF